MQIAACLVEKVEICLQKRLRSNDNCCCQKFHFGEDVAIVGRWEISFVLVAVAHVFRLTLFLFEHRLMMEFEVSDASSASSAEENANESSENEQEEEVEEVSAEDRVSQAENPF